MKCRVYYWKDPKYLLMALPAEPGLLISEPTPEKLAEDYEVFWEGEVPDNTTPDDIFVKFNLIEGRIRLPPGIGHTSMSVGDIVQLNDNYYVCMPLGWQKL